MAGFRISRRGRKVSVGNKQPKRDRIAEKAIRELDTLLPPPETTPDRMTWPHWAGCKAHPGHMPLTSHGEITSPYIKSLKRKKDDE